MMLLLTAVLVALLGPTLFMQTRAAWGAAGACAASGTFGAVALGAVIPEPAVQFFAGFGPWGWVASWAPAVVVYALLLLRAHR